MPTCESKNIDIQFPVYHGLSKLSLLSKVLLFIGVHKHYSTKLSNLGGMDSKLFYNLRIEILLRSSLNTLGTMRCTNKEYENLTYHPHLLNVYKQRNNIVCGFLVVRGQNGCDFTEFAPSHGSKSLDLGFLPHNAEILASSEQGIIVFEVPHPMVDGLVRYHVCKPTTKQVLALPNPKTKYLTKRVSMVVMGSKPLRYKIIRLSEPKFNPKYDRYYTTYYCEIFDSRAWTWRRQDLLVFPFHDFLPCQQPITVRGSIYMLTTNNDVLKFNAYSEKWTTFSIPIEDLDYILIPRKLVKYQGKLGFASMTPGRLSWEIWVLTIDESWERLHVFFAQSLLEAIYDSDTIVMREDMALVFYRFKEGDYICKVSLFVGHGWYYYMRIFPFGSDFEQRKELILKNIHIYNTIAFGCTQPPPSCNFLSLPKKIDDRRFC
ncbi:unnamed protein product [Lactuca saligna]|uniref:F-box associated beta-propeller type 3 domain-containing protein n=1 Tax=Lactuca saligna TaxID=75948 RepID=A0AA35YE89_LACSI|nr:unnamed protein product [Lactuca saligna]